MIERSLRDTLPVEPRTARLALRIDPNEQAAARATTPRR
jgi:hypothetical protein